MAVVLGLFTSKKKYIDVLDRSIDVIQDFKPSV